MTHDPEKQKPFWMTLPGILTGAASLITAIVALVNLFSGSPRNTREAASSSPVTIQQSVNLKNLNECFEITGTWNWFTGGETKLAKDGSLEWRMDPASPLPNVIGRWSCTDTRPRTYLLSWQHGITDAVNLSPDGGSLAGSNQTGARVSATRKS